MEVTSEEPPAKENPTNNDQVANTEDEDGQNDSIEEATNSAHSPGDQAKDKCSEDSNLDDSTTSSEQMTKSQKKSQKKRRNRANKLAREEEENRLLMEEAIKTPLKDKDEGEDHPQPDQEPPEAPKRMAPLFLSEKTPAKATKSSSRISKIARKKSSPRNK